MGPFVNYTHSEQPWALPKVTLVVRKDDLDPRTVTERLGLKPTGTRRPGPDPWAPEGDEAGLWLLKYDRTGPSLVQHLEELLDAVAPRGHVLRELASEGHDVVINAFGYVGTGSTEELSPEMVARIASLGAVLDLGVSISER